MAVELEGGESSRRCSRGGGVRLSFGCLISPASGYRHRRRRLNSLTIYFYSPRLNITTNYERDGIKSLLVFKVS
jgi:hypothetical protein